MSDLTAIPIFIDTNVLLHHFDYKINIEEALERIINRKYVIFVHRMVEAEILEALSKKGKTGRNAKVAVQMISRYQGFEDDTDHEGTDSALIQSAIKQKGCVFTFDKELKRRCKELMIPTISIYKQGRLQLVGEIE